jgi:hypothetical protein
MPLIVFVWYINLLKIAFKQVRMLDKSSIRAINRVHILGGRISKKARRSREGGREGGGSRVLVRQVGRA